MAVTTLVRDEARAMVPRDLVDRVVRRLRVALRALGRSRSSVSVLFTDDREIRTLNARYRTMDRATDVLSFHMQELAGEDDPAGLGVFLGDIVISVETAKRRAPGGRLRPELERLAVHGLCHLFGHDHKRPGEARVMFALERRLLRLPVEPVESPPQRGLKRTLRGSSSRAARATGRAAARR